MCVVSHYLLELLKSVEMHNGHEYMYVIGQDAYMRVICQSSLLTY